MPSTHAKMTKYLWLIDKMTKRLQTVKSGLTHYHLLEGKRLTKWLDVAEETQKWEIYTFENSHRISLCFGRRKNIFEETFFSWSFAQQQVEQWSINKNCNITMYWSCLHVIPCRKGLVNKRVAYSKPLLMTTIWKGVYVHLNKFRSSKLKR